MAAELSSSSPPPTESSEFRYLPELDFLLKQIAPSTSSTCEIINIKPITLDNFAFQPQQKVSTTPKEMRSRQHLQYEVIRTFNDANEFDQWWTHEGGAKGWIFNTIYKKKTEDEVHVYRCGHKRCSLRLRVVFVANSCDVRVEQALIEHMHDDNAPKADSIKTLSTEVKSKIANLEDKGLTATKIRRNLFKESDSNGNLPTLKQVQNYIARIRTSNKRPSPNRSQSPTPSGSIASVSVTPINIEPLDNLGPSEEQKILDQLLAKKSLEPVLGEISTPHVPRKRGRPRLNPEQRVERVFPQMFHKPVAKVEIVQEKEEEDEEDDADESGILDETEAVHKFSQLLEASQPTMKRQRFSYHFERSFKTKEEFKEWWSGQKFECMVHNSTYSNNAGDQIDIYRCNKRDCHHRFRVVTNPNDGSVCFEKTDIGHDLSAHEARGTLTKNAKMVITELFERGFKPKAIRTHFLQSTHKASETPSITQIKNLLNRLKSKQKPDTIVDSPGFSFLDLFNDQLGQTGNQLNLNDD